MVNKDRGYVLFQPDKEAVSVFGGESCYGEKDKGRVRKGAKIDKYKKKKKKLTNLA